VTLLKLKYVYIVRIRPVGADLLHAARRTDGRDEVNIYSSKFRESAKKKGPNTRVLISP